VGPSVSKGERVSEPRGPLVDCAAARPFEILRHVRCHLYIPALGHKILRVVCLVGSHGHSTVTWNLFQHNQCGIPLSGAIGLKDLGSDNEPVAILRHQVPHVAELGLAPVCLPIELGFAIGRALMRRVRAFLTAEVDGRIARIIRWLIR